MLQFHQKGIETTFCRIHEAAEWF